jgi:hypothetical protein
MPRLMNCVSAADRDDELRSAVLHLCRLQSKATVPFELAARWS